MLIVPRPGLKIRNPVTRLIVPDDGIEISDTSGHPTDPYWQRLLRDGDVTVVQPATAHAAVMPEAPPETPPHVSPAASDHDVQDTAVMSNAPSDIPDHVTPTPDDHEGHSA